MPQSLAAYRTFLHEFRRTFYTTGAILPSGRFLSAALARYVGDGKELKVAGPRRILEVGPGSGAVTDSIVDRLGPDDRLDLVEINPNFVELLRTRFAEDPRLAAVSSRVQIFPRPIQEMADQGRYHLIISGLPLNNFPARDVEDILGVLTSLLEPGGRLSFFEYIAIRKIKSCVGKTAARQRLREVGQVINAALRKGEVRREAVWLNVPPAWVHHVDLHRG
jgi:phospholipid N-methyltransferase